MTNNTTTCSECGAEILPRTSAKTGGKCMPCATGIRAQIEESKRRAVEARERERTNEAALERIRRGSAPTFGHFLAEDDPMGTLWPYLVSVVFHDETEDIAALTDRAKALYLPQVLDGEVINGGFHQYFSNSSGTYAHETLAGLFELGAVEAAKLLQEAIHLFPQKRVPKDWSERHEHLDAIDSGLLDALDTKYYALADGGTEDLAERILSFMKQHSGEHVARPG